MSDILKIKEEVDHVGAEQDRLLEDVSVPEDEVKPPVSLVMNLLKHPFVYTTRLEDMHIIKYGFKGSFVGDIINQVETESRPRLIRQCTVKKEKSKKNRSGYFNITTSQVKLANSKKTTVNMPYVKTVARDLVNNNKTELLMQMCKPFSVTLVDCKPLLRYKFCTRHRTIQLLNNILNCEKCVKYYNVSDKLEVKRKKRAVLIENHDQPESSDFDNSCAEKVSSINKNHENNEFFNCCWYRSLKNIQKVWPGSMTVADGTHRNFLVHIKPHACPPNICSCCCKKEASSRANNTSVNTKPKSMHSNLKMPSEKTWSNYQQFISNTESHNKNSLINKALQYRRKPKPKTFEQVASSQLPSLAPHSVVQFQSLKDMDQLYILGADASMQFYVEVDKSDKSHYTYMSKIGESGLNSVKDRACCSLQRLKIWSELPRQMINFLQKTPHNYLYSQNKKCCHDKTIYYPKVQLEQIEYPKTFSHTKNNTTRLKEVFKNVDLRTTNNVRHQCKHLNLKNLNRKHIHNQPRVHQEANDSNSLAKIAQQQKSDNLQSPTNVLITPPSITSIFQSSELLQQEEPTVQVLIASILERFKNIRLSLNAEGKIVALLDTPATALSSDELTILSDIIGRVQEQVKMLGIIDNSSSNLADPLNDSQNININLIRSQKYGTNIENEFIPCPRTNEIPLNPKPLLTSCRKNFNVSCNRKRLKKNSSLGEETEKIDKVIHASSDIYEAYTSLTHLKNEQYQRSLEAYKKHSKGSFAPKIKNVYSLNEGQTKKTKSDKVSYITSSTQTDISKIKRPRKRSLEKTSILENILKSKKTKTDSSSSLTLKNTQKKNKSPVTIQKIVNNDTSTVNQLNSQYLPQPILVQAAANSTINAPFQCFVAPENVDSSLVGLPMIQNNSIPHNTPLSQYVSVNVPESSPRIIILPNTLNKGDDADDCILGV
ncbi:unnamed protein product [Diatraea saccharalis]|uniref:Uncharacterized protein n=1 Tax=Diatraea saccharalis TaxID=40085 RepID=A0A9N9RAJ2_9NEOP|nr:unnamed protein product [Diatraea saccharalis]